MEASKLYLHNFEEALNLFGSAVMITTAAVYATNNNARIGYEFSETHIKAVVFGMSLKDRLNLFGVTCDG